MKYKYVLYTVSIDYKYYPKFIIDEIVYEQYNKFLKTDIGQWCCENSILIEQSMPVYRPVYDDKITSFYIILDENQTAEFQKNLFFEKLTND
jgi:hypothetical protein